MFSFVRKETVWMNVRSVASAKDWVLRYNVQSHWVSCKNQLISAIAHIFPASLSCVSLLQFSLQISFSSLVFSPVSLHFLVHFVETVLCIFFLSLSVSLCARLGSLPVDHLEMVE